MQIKVEFDIEHLSAKEIAFFQNSGHKFPKIVTEIDRFGSPIFRTNIPWEMTFKDFGSFGRFFLLLMNTMGRADVSMDTDIKAPVITISDPE